MEFVIFWKVFINKIQKSFCYVCFYIYTIRWVKPDNISHSASISVVADDVRFIFDIFPIPTCRKSIIIIRCGCVKKILVDEILLILLDMLSGIDFIIDGGWFDFVFI